MAKKNKILCTPLDNTSHLGVLYKKNSNENFQDPFQNTYGEDKENKIEEIKLENYGKFRSKLSDNKQSVFNSDVDHQNQIEELLGDRIWNFKLGKIFNKEYIKKVIQVLFKRQKDPY